jgi:hypothetical protein
MKIASPPLLGRRDSTSSPSSLERNVPPPGWTVELDRLEELEALTQLSWCR